MPIVTVFGGNAIETGDAGYQEAYELGRLLGQAGLHRRHGRLLRHDGGDQSRREGSRRACYRCDDGAL